MENKKLILASLGLFGAAITAYVVKRCFYEVEGNEDSKEETLTKMDQSASQESKNVLIRQHLAPKFE